MTNIVYTHTYRRARDAQYAYRSLTVCTPSPISWLSGVEKSPSMYPFTGAIVRGAFGRLRCYRVGTLTRNVYAGAASTVIACLGGGVKASKGISIFYSFPYIYTPRRNKVVSIARVYITITRRQRQKNNSENTGSYCTPRKKRSWRRRVYEINRKLIIRRRRRRDFHH